MLRFNPHSRLHVHDEVAIMRPHTWGDEIVGLTTVKHVGHVLVETDDGRFYSASDGESIGARQLTYLEPVTGLHRAALERRRRKQSGGQSASAATAHSAPR